MHFGAGRTRVLLWSQMHGDEPTHTMALTDLLAYLAREPDDPCVRRLHERLTVVAVPMPNPDGAERFRRLNAQGIDTNRDARARSTPEVRALLASTFDEGLGDNEVRLRAKRVGAVVCHAVQPLIGGHVSRFPEEHDPRGTGEFMAASGTSTLLLECGGWKDDPEKQFLRKVSFVALLASLEAIADGSYAGAPLEAYEALPEVGDSAFDVLVRGGTVVVPGLEPYRADVGIEFPAPLDAEDGRVSAIGDLLDSTAVEILEADGLFLHPHAEALLSDRGAAGVLRDGSPASFDLREGPEPWSALRGTITHGRIGRTDATDASPAWRRAHLERSTPSAAPLLHPGRSLARERIVHCSTLPWTAGEAECTRESGG